MAEPEEDKAAEKFLNDCAKFSGGYEEFVVIVKTSDNHFRWKCTDKTWAIGAAKRFLWSSEELERMDEREDWHNG